MFFLIGIILSAFLFVLLVFKRNKSYADRILTIWMGVMAFHQLISYLTYSGVAYDYPFLLGVVLPWPLLHGPFLFIYVMAITHEKPLHWRQILPHFVPFLILVLLAVPFYMRPATEKIEVFRNQGAGYEWYNLLQSILVVALGLGYSIWSLICIRRHRAKIIQWFSNTDKLMLRQENMMLNI